MSWSAKGDGLLGYWDLRQWGRNGDGIPKKKEQWLLWLQLVCTGRRNKINLNLNFLRFLAWVLARVPARGFPGPVGSNPGEREMREEKKGRGREENGAEIPLRA